MPVALPSLPEPVSLVVARVAEFYALVRGLRLSMEDDRPVPFACGWVAEKIGVRKVAVWRARNRLVEAGVLVHAGTLPGRGKRGTDLFLPGALEGRAVGVEAHREPEVEAPDDPVVRAAVAVNGGLARVAVAAGDSADLGGRLFDHGGLSSVGNVPHEGMAPTGWEAAP